jgi:hypothetical protein
VRCNPEEGSGISDGGRRKTFYRFEQLELAHQKVRHLLRVWIVSFAFRRGRNSGEGMDMIGMTDCPGVIFFGMPMRPGR